MSAMLRPIEAQDLKRVSEFLFQTHGLTQPVTFAHPSVLEWKYLYPRSGRTGTRAFVLEKKGRIIAHGGVVPALFKLPSGESIPSATVIDWAADPSVPGAGIILINKLQAQTGPLFVIGGSEAARRVLPKIGFRAAGEINAYAGWVRPWKEFRLRAKSGRSWLRLAHGLVHPLRPDGMQEGWDTLPVEKFDDSIQKLLDNRVARLPWCSRTVEHLNYMLRCPAVKMNGFLLRRRGNTVGYFILGKAGWEGRVVDIQMELDNLSDWKAAYGIAIDTICRDSEICRISAWATSPVSEVLLELGFWLQGKKPIQVRDPANQLARAFPANLQLLDGEAAFLLDEEDRNSRVDRLK
jgi:hypothetical protein